jgi:protein-arginine deiminase
MKLERGGGLSNLVQDRLASGVGFDFPGGTATSHNFGGNIEVTPVYTNGAASFPFGRLLYGGGSAGTVTGPITTTMNTDQVAYMNAQGVQGPAVEVSSEWLAVGHVDEIFIFIPNGQGSFVLLIASPDLARQALTTLSGQGLGAETVFEGRMAETTVDGVLNDANLMAYNNAVQTRIDTIRTQLQTLMGLTNGQIVDLPVLYEQVTFEGHAVAYNPGAPNLVCVNSAAGGTTLFVPDPEGPNNASGQDVWQEQIDQALQATGHTIVYVDIFESYHEFMGEAHCGANTRRASFQAKWWEQ